MIKIKIILCCLFFLSLSALAQKQGIHFSKGSWAKVLEEAKQSKKLIFVNVYTEWSESCRKMRSEIFPLKEVGEKYNAHFINYRIDADWREGITFSQRHQVIGYPTYLYINGDGDVLYRGSGYNDDPKWLLALADTALYIHDAKQTLPVYQASYQGRKDDKAFVMEYLNRMAIFGMSDNGVLNHFFSQLSPSELKDTVIARLLLRSLITVQSTVFDHIMANQSFYRGFTPELPLTLGKVIYNSLAVAKQTADHPLFNKAHAFRNKLEDPPLGYPYMVFQASNQYYLTTRQHELMIERTAVFMDSICRVKDEEFIRLDQKQFDQIMEAYRSGELDSMEVEDFSYQQELWRTGYSRYVANVMSNTAALFLQHTEKKEDLRKACIWAARSVDMDPYSYSFYGVLSKLYDKMGMKKEARSTMESAIELARSQGVSDTILKMYRDALKAM